MSGYTNIVGLLCIGLTVSLAESASASETRKKTAKSGASVGLFSIGQIDPMTCKADQNAYLQPTVRKQPLHGSLDVRRVQSTFHSMSGRHICDGKPYEAAGIFYTSARGYRGSDVIEFSSTSLVGRMEVEKLITYEIDVQ